MTPPGGLSATLLMFGLPFAASLLGLARGLAWCYNGWRRSKTEASGVRDSEADERSPRERVALGAALALGSAALAVHTGGWLLRLV